MNELQYSTDELEFTVKQYSVHYLQVNSSKQILYVSRFWCERKTVVGLEGSVVMDYDLQFCPEGKV